MSDLVGLTAVDGLVRRMVALGDAPAVVSTSGSVSFAELIAASERWSAELIAHGVGTGAVCGYLGDYGPETIALFIALMRLRAIAMPLTPAVERELPSFIQISGLQQLIRIESGGARFVDTITVPGNALIEEFRQLTRPGLVVFTSGSTGRPKGILHDLERVLARFAGERPGFRTVMFLMMDHFGGINTLLSVMAYGGVAICVGERSPEGICRAIDRGRAELLPTTPTFLNMLLASGAWRHYDLSSVRLITYGTEPMPPVVLRRMREIFPHAVLKQTYGLSELGVLRSQSPDPSSLWMRIGGDGFETRIVNNILHIRSRSSMVGYLNAPSPIDADGWMNTGDIVEERDGLVRFVGRASEVINVGGQKVFPAEVETVLLEADNVTEVTVFGVRHPLLGQVVRARVSLARPESEEILADRLQEHCRARLTKFKVPLRFDIAALGSQVTDRIKKRR